MGPPPCSARAARTGRGISAWRQHPRTARGRPGRRTHKRGVDATLPWQAPRKRRPEGGAGGGDGDEGRLGHRHADPRCREEDPHHRQAPSIRHQGNAGGRPGGPGQEGCRGMAGDVTGWWPTRVCRAWQVRWSCATRSSRLPARWAARRRACGPRAGVGRGRRSPNP